MTTTPTIWKAQHQVNFTDSGDQGDPQIVTIGNGRYVVVWTEASYNNPAGPIAPEPGSDIIAQMFDANGNRIGNEFRANVAFFGSNEFNPAVAARPDGGWMLVYQGADANGDAICAQEFDVNGNALASATIFKNTATSGVHVSNPSIAIRADGTYVIAFDHNSVIYVHDTSTNPDKRFDTGLRTVGSGETDVAVNAFGEAIIAYEYRVDPNFPDARYEWLWPAIPAHDIYANLADFVDLQAAPQTEIKAAGLEFDRWIVVWTEENGDTDGQGIRARMVNSIGYVGPAFSVNVSIGGDQNEPDVIGLKDGGFVVVWDNELTNDIRGQRFDANGGFVGTEFIAGAADGSETNPTLELLSDGRFIVAFQRTDGDNDILATIFDPRDATIDGNNNNDTINGRIDGGTVNGLGGNDTLQGGAGTDNLNGGAGNDTLIAGSGAGNDRYDGGTGTDTIVFASATQPVTVNLAAAYNHAVGAQTGTDQIVNVENVVGGRGNDKLFGNAAINRLEGGFGDDIYVVNAGDKVIEKAGQGYDTVAAGVSHKLQPGSSVEVLRTLSISTNTRINLTGNELINKLTGNAAANALDGGGDADTMAGAFGNDLYRVGNRLDKVMEVPGQGTDTVMAAVSYALQTGSSVEVLRTTAVTTAINLTGNNLINRLYGNGAANALDGRAGADIMAGGGGNDVYRVDNRLDRVIEAANQGSDVVITAVSYALQTGSDINLLRTSNASSTAALSLTGNALGQTIQGNAGANVLTGGGGKDTMTGGAGADDIDFNSIAEIGNGATRDIIRDFVHLTDDIDLSTIDANGAAIGNTAFSFLAAHGAAFTGAAGQLHWFRQDLAGTANDRTIIEGDINGNRVADFQIQLTGLKTLTVADFVL